MASTSQRGNKKGKQQSTHTGHRLLDMVQGCAYGEGEGWGGGLQYKMRCVGMCPSKASKEDEIQSKGDLFFLFVMHRSG